MGGSENKDFVHLCTEGLVISILNAIRFIAVVNASAPDHSICSSSGCLFQNSSCNFGTLFDVVPYATGTRMPNFWPHNEDSALYIGDLSWIHFLPCVVDLRNRILCICALRAGYIHLFILLFLNCHSIYRGCECQYPWSDVFSLWDAMNLGGCCCYFGALFGVVAHALGTIMPSIWPHNEDSAVYMWYLSWMHFGHLWW